MTQDSALKGIKLQNEQLFKQVAQQIQDIIIGGSLKAGDKLPSERTLAEQLSVSRTVIREALKLLEDRGLITISVGSGTYVSEIQAKDVAQPLSLYIQQRQTSIRHLVEIRRMIEVETAGLAAKNATEEDIAVLEAALKSLEQSKPGSDAFVEADFLFHQQLARASQNPLMPLLLDPIREQMQEFFRLAAQPPGSPDDAVRHHRNILNCVKAHDIVTARQAMRTHLDWAERWSEMAAGESTADSREDQ